MMHYNLVVHPCTTEPLYPTKYVHRVVWTRLEVPHKLSEPLNLFKIFPWDLYKKSTQMYRLGIDQFSVQFCQEIEQIKN